MYFYGWKFWEADKGLLQSLGNCHVSATTLASNFVGFQQRCLDAKTRPCQSGTFKNRTASDRFWVRKGCNDNVICVYNISKKSMYTSWWNISSQVKGFSKWNKFVIPHASDLQLRHLQLGGLETPQGHKGASHPGHNATPFGISQGLMPAGKCWKIVNRKELLVRQGCLSKVHETNCEETTIAEWHPSPWVHFARCRAVLPVNSWSKDV